MTASNPDEHTSFYHLAKADFDRARQKGFWRAVGSWLSNEENELLPFDIIRQRLPFHGEHYLGVRQIEVDKIVGSVSRYSDFDSAFLPRQTHTRSRWESIDRALLQDIILPPIEVYKVGELYFVKDGNHRVSVAREKGQVYIDAEVIEIDTSVFLDSRDDLSNLVLLEERIRFYETTNLTNLRENVNIEFTIQGQYDNLLRHIETHRYFLGVETGQPVSYEDAVCSWYDHVYLPLVEVIRKQEILKEFPTRTEADLYIWIIEHLGYLREEYAEVTAEQAAAHFAREYSEHPVHRLVNLVRKAGGLE